MKPRARLKLESKPVRTVSPSALSAGQVQGPTMHAYPVLVMQGVIGNRGVQRLLRSGVLQRKLTIGAPDDIYEKEADRVAHQIISLAAIRRVGAPNGLRGDPFVRLHRAIGSRELVRLLGTDRHPGSLVPDLRRKCSCGGGVEGECTACAVNRIERHVSFGESADWEAPLIVDEVLATQGQPLADSVRKTLEPDFGADFDQVRIHTDAKAAESAHAVDALAYTVSNHIVFAEGQYAPGTSAGDHLLAHELTHTIQQGAAGTKPAQIQQTRGSDSEHRGHPRAGPPARLQRVHLDPSGRKVFDCSDFAGDRKLEACLNDEDRLNPSERGPTVAKVQNGLLKDGADLGKDGADGVYGPTTARAVKAFKTKHHLGFEQFPDVGPGTMAKLDELCAGSKPGPTPPPAPTPPAPTPKQCFDTIDWDAFFEQAEPDCRLNQASIDAICALAPSSPFNIGPNICSSVPFEQRVEDCVADVGFSELFATCGIPGSGQPGKSEIRNRFRDFKKRHP